MNVFREYINKLRGPKMLDKHLFDNGYYLHAKWVGLNIGRLGGHIVPYVIVVHTTDTYPGGFKAIVRSWVDTDGAGNAATFMIGRSDEDGLVQFASIYRNSNHAGGVKHGWFVGRADNTIHPNSISVGIEIDNAGKLVKHDGHYMHKDSGKLIPDEDVYIHSDGSAWHKINQYQHEQLKFLIADLRQQFGPVEFGKYRIVPNGAYKDNQALWAVPQNNELVGHASLDPYNKSDPGPEIMGLINKW